MKGHKIRNKTFTLKELLADKSPAPPAIIEDGILNHRSLLMIHGTPKAGKSFFAANLALGIAAGRGFAGFRIHRPKRVLVLSAEGGYYSNRDRLLTMAKSLSNEQAESAELSCCFDSRWKLDDAESFRDLEAFIGESQAEVIVIDPLVRFHEGEENSAKEMSTVLGRIRKLIEDLGISVILVHHEGKDASRGVRGSSAISGEYDAAIGLSMARGSHKLHFDLRHAENPPDLTLTFNSETFWFEGANPNKIVRLIDAIGHPVTKKELAEACTTREYYSTVQNAYKGIDAAVKKGLIAQDANGCYNVAA